MTTLPTPVAKSTPHNLRPPPTGRPAGTQTIHPSSGKRTSDKRRISRPPDLPAANRLRFLFQFQYSPLLLSVTHRVKEGTTKDRAVQQATRRALRTAESGKRRPTTRVIPPVPTPIR